MRDIGESNVTIKEFQQIERTRSEMGNNKSERIHMPNSLIESVASAKLELAPAEQLKTQKLEPEKAVLAASAEYSEEEEDYEEMPDKIESLINNLDLEDAELEQKLKDELDEEVDKKFKTQIRAEE
jgi:dsDNA-specific endonuclease/ATPase MutS2